MLALERRDIELDRPVYSDATPACATNIRQMRGPFTRAAAGDLKDLERDAKTPSMAA